MRKLVNFRIVGCCPNLPIDICNFGKLIARCRGRNVADSRVGQFQFLNGGRQAGDSDDSDPRNVCGGRLLIVYGDWNDVNVRRSRFLRLNELWER